VNSVGNSGSSSWKYMGAPADAASVISVGAVNASGGIASFSSFGPTSDGRIKPEILGQGQNPALIHYLTGEVTNSSSGTSFSSPIMAGLIACLNQNESFDNTSVNLNEFLKQTVYKSADRYNAPLDQYGYGIPNFETALNSYSSHLSILDENSFNLTVFPNPVKDSFNISSDDFSDVSIQIYTVVGKKVFEKTQLAFNNIDISFLNKGIYLLKITKGNQHKMFKIIKE